MLHVWSVSGEEVAVVPKEEAGDGPSPQTSQTLNPELRV